MIWESTLHFDELSVAGAFVIRPQLREDNRGHFARIWCQEELAKRGLVDRVVQVNSGFSPKSGTLRGMHFQRHPHAEVKIARCTRGAVFDVVIDLRLDSPTYRAWAGVALTAQNGHMLYVPEGCAHGYLTTAPDTELVYFTSHRYEPASAGGVRHDDRAFGIAWPAPVALISDADAAWPAFTDESAQRAARSDA
jgi:dTDP-4-dehydrorhamnose 3,5-epimerase